MHNMLTDLARSNQYIISDMLIIAMQDNGKKQDNYANIGGVFTRAAKAGYIEKAFRDDVRSNTAKTVWRSLVYGKPSEQDGRIVRTKAGASQISRVLKLIKRKRGATNWELSLVALKYTSVISELRAEGHNILAERQHLKNGRPSNTWLYTLLDEDELKQETQA